MKLLVYGAGVTGSLFSARLHEAGHDVSLLARGERLAALRRYGVQLAEADSPAVRRVPVPVVDHPADQRERVIKPGPQPGPLDIVYPGQRGRPGFFSPNTPKASQWRPSRYLSGPVRFCYQPARPSADKITICGWSTVPLPKLSIVIPALDEERNIPYVFPGRPENTYEVILVDGRSIDRTVEAAQKLRP